MCGILALVFTATSSQSDSALDIVQQGIVVSAQSPTITVHNEGLGNNLKVAPRIEFNKIDDFITYRLTLHNNDDKKYKITSVTDNNTNDAIEFTYVYPTILDTADKAIELTIKYVKKSSTPLQAVTITINLVDENHLGQQTFFTVPNTGSNTITDTHSATIRNTIFIYVAIAAVIIVVYVIIHCKYKRAQKSTKLPKILATSLLLIGLIPVAVIAMNLKDLQFIIEFNHVKLNGPYTITFNTTTTDTIPPQTIDHNDFAKKPSDPIKTGYTFVNWLDENNRAYDFNQPVTKDANLTANFTLNSYSITYTLPAGATNATTNPATYTYEDNDITLAAPTMNHYDFIGWTTPTDTTPQLTVTIPKNSIGDKTFIANFTPHKYTITYILNGGTGVTNPTEYAANTPAFTLDAPTSPSPTSKYFKGWLDKSTPTSPTTPQPSITITPGVTTGNLVFEAIFQDFYTVNFDGNNGSGVMNSQRIDSGQATNLSTNTFTRTNFTFDGWNTKANGTGANYTDSQEVTDLVGAGKSITLYAKWYGGNIFYNDNGANSTTKMGNQTIAPTSTDALLWASNFKHSDHTKTFAGWNTKADGNGTKYGPNQTILDDATLKKIKEENITLYAMWIESEGTMQSWNGCAAMNIGDVKALTDNRDGNTYAIAKLADNKCWMIENLRLSNTHTVTGDPVGINSFNTNNPATGFTALPASSNNWCTYSNLGCIDQLLLNTANTTNTESTMLSPNSNVYSYGNYYNWYTATAGNGGYHVSNNNISAVGDICPVGWRLPKGGDNKNKAISDFYQLSTSVIGAEPANITIPGNSTYPYYTGDPEGTNASRAFRSYPNNLIYNGIWNSNSPNSRSSISYYWSSTTNNNFNAYNMSISKISVVPGTGLPNKYLGNVIRCVSQ